MEPATGMTTLLWGLSGGALAVAIEYVFRRTTGSYWSLLPWLVAPALLVNYAVFELVRGSDSLIAAFITFAAATALLRVVASLAVGDTVTTGTWIGLGLVGAAKAVQMVGR